MTTSKLTVDEGTQTPLATYEINEDAEDKQLARTVLNAEDGTELGTSSDPLQVAINQTGNNNAVDVLTSALPTGAATAANQQTDALTDVELRASPVPVSGTISVNEPVSVDDNGGSLTVDNATLSVVGGGTEATAQRVTLANDSTGVLSVDDNGGSLTVDGTVAVTDGGGSLTVDGPLTDAQLRATPVPVDVSDTQFQAVGAAADGAAPSGNPVLVAGQDGTNVQSLKTNATGQLEVAVVSSTGGGLTDAELRASPVPVSGTVSVTEPVSVDDNGGSLTVDNAALSVVGGGAEATALRVTVADDSTGVLSVDDNGGSLTVDGAVTANAGTNLNTSALALESGGNLAAIAASASVLDDWDESDRAKVNPIAGQAGVQGGSGAVTALTQRTTLATDVALPAGTNLLGKVNNVPLATDGCDIFRSLDLDETEEEVKGTAGTLYGYFIANLATTTRFVKFYNATAANVTVGTTTPVLTLPIPGNSTDDQAANLLGGVGIKFDTAITVAATTGLADNDTGAPGANDVVINAFFK